MQGSMIKSAILLSLFGWSAAQSNCPAPVTVTVTAGAPAPTTTAATTTSSAPTCATAAAVPGYTTEWSCQNAAADGAGYLAYYATETFDPKICANYCGANSDCQFFNVYQELASDGTTNNICVLWNQDKPLSSATNTYNLGRPISNSAGYKAQAVLSSSSAAPSTTSVAPVTTSVAPITTSVVPSTTSAAPTTTTAALVTPSVVNTPVSGYTLEWSQQNAAANCAGYLTSNVADVWNVQGCADQCTSNDQCAFFNVYQQQVGSTFNYVCVLWSQDQPLTCATNSYNNGQPISASGGYLKNVPKVSTTSSSSVATTSSSSSSSSVATTSTTVRTTTSSSSSSSSSTSTSSRAATTSTSAAATSTSTSSRAATTSTVAPTTSTVAPTTSSTAPATTSAAVRTTSTLSTSTRSTSTTSSASLCPNGTPVPTQCAGQNQFVVSTFLGGIQKYLTFDPASNGAQTTLVNRLSDATTYYFDSNIGRLRTCPCAGVPFYRYSTSDPIDSDGFRMTLSKGVVDGSTLAVQNGKTAQGIYWKHFDNNGNLGISTYSWTATPEEGAILALTIKMVTV